MSRTSSLGRASSSTTKRRLQDLLIKSENRVCADCSAPNPKWASANIGVFMCLKCCGVHRSLGTHISKVLSVTLDDWSDDDVDAMIEVGGNASVNAVYEAYIPEGVSKPKPDSSHDDRANFIRSKYELQEFMKPGLRMLSTSAGRSSHQEGLVEYSGMLKIKVIKGTNLAVRDMRTSDPYVVLALGDKKAQTSVKSSNLNPVWNEELMFSVPGDGGTIKLEVYDQDTLSGDDIMGEAEIDIQPLITAGMPYGDAGMYGDMQIGKWMKSEDNALMEDSIINIVDGKIKQDMSIKLQKVESGEIELELEWMPLEE